MSWVQGFRKCRESNHHPKKNNAFGQLKSSNDEPLLASRRDVWESIIIVIPMECTRIVRVSLHGTETAHARTGHFFLLRLFSASSWNGRRNTNLQALPRPAGSISHELLCRKRAALCSCSAARPLASFALRIRTAAGWSTRCSPCQWCTRIRWRSCRSRWRWTCWSGCRSRDSGRLAAWPPCCPPTNFERVLSTSLEGASALRLRCWARSLRTESSAEI